MQVPFTDCPIRHPDHDCLGRGRLVSAVADVIGQAAGTEALTVGVFGGWGEGKTSVLRLLEGALPQRDDKIVPVWFDAWPYGSDHEALWRALVVTVLESLRGWVTDQSGREKIDLVEETLQHSTTVRQKGDLTWNWAALGPTALRGMVLAAHLATGGLATPVTEVLKKIGSGEDGKALADLARREETERFHAQVRAVDQFRATLRSLLTEHVAGQGRRLVVLIDDLDRCLPDTALGALENVKVFMDLPGLVFVLAVDPTLVEVAITKRYGLDKSDGLVKQYLDKIVQIPVLLPSASPDDLEKLASDWWQAYGGGLPDSCAKIIARGCPPSPRVVRRTLGLFALFEKLYRGGGSSDREQAERLAKVVLIRLNYPKVFDDLMSQPQQVALHAETGRYVRDETNGRLLDVLSSSTSGKLSALPEDDLRRLLRFASQAAEGRK